MGTTILIFSTVAQDVKPSIIGIRGTKKPPRPSVARSLFVVGRHQPFRVSIRADSTGPGGSCHRVSKVCAWLARLILLHVADMSFFDFDFTTDAHDATPSSPDYGGALHGVIRLFFVTLPVPF
jgi:hypothetical protein